MHEPNLVNRNWKSKFEFFNWFLLKIILFIVNEKIKTIMNQFIRYKKIVQEF